jgi:hypothetical protein
MSHDCADTAYPAASIPGECTCPPDLGLSEAEEERQARIRIFGSDPDEEESR